jgi:SAM-dependent methyltransferase
MEKYPGSLNRRKEIEKIIYDEHCIKDDKIIRPFYYHNRKYEEKFINAIIKKFNITKQSKILDLGCGNGLYSEIFYLNGMIVTGIDLSETAIRYCNNKYGNNIDFLCLDAFSMDYKDKYDVVFCNFFTYFNSFDNLEDANEYVDIMMRYVKKGGHLFFVWISDLTAIRLPMDRFNIMNYTVKQLKCMFSKYENRSFAIDSVSRLTYYLGDKAFGKYVTKLACAIVQFLDSSWSRVRIVIAVKKTTKS